MENVGSVNRNILFSGGHLSGALFRIGTSREATSR